MSSTSQGLKLALGGAAVGLGLAFLSEQLREVPVEEGKADADHGSTAGGKADTTDPQPPMRLSSSRQPGSPVTIHLGSGSDAKAEAVKLAFAKMHSVPPNAVYVFRHAVLSNVGEQPVGDGETLLGAMNRLHNTLEDMSESEIAGCDYVVAIENGIMETRVEGAGLLDTVKATESGDNNSTEAPSTSIWYDKAAIVVRNSLGDYSTAWSAAVRVPGPLLEAARELDFSKTDIGAAAQRVMPEITDPKDPHDYLTRSVLPRPALLEQGLMIALAQLPRE